MNREGTGKPQGGLESRSHQAPANTRAVLSEQEMAQYYRQVHKFLGETPPELLVAPLIAGVDVVMVYEKGRLSGGTTWAGGSTGTDVTGSLKTILTVPLALEPLSDAPPVPERLDVRARVYVERETFKALNRSRADTALPVFADPGEAAADSLLQDQRQAAVARALNIFCTGAGRPRGSHPETHYELLIALQQWGLRVDRPHLRVCTTFEEAAARCRELEKSQPEFPYELAGARISLNRLEHQRLLEESPDAPGSVIAFRFKVV